MRDEIREFVEASQPIIHLLSATEALNDSERATLADTVLLLRGLLEYYEHLCGQRDDPHQAVLYERGGTA